MPDILGIGSDHTIRRTLSLPLGLEVGSGGAIPHQIGGVQRIKQIEDILQELFTDGWNPNILYLNPKHFEFESAIHNSAFGRPVVLYFSGIAENEIIIREIGVSLEDYLTNIYPNGHEEEQREMRAKYLPLNKVNG